MFGRTIKFNNLRHSPARVLSTAGIIKLIQPPTRNWILIADELDDPRGWDRFLPCQTVSSERRCFDSAVKQTAAGRFKISPCKDLLKSGTSVFEYAWEADEWDILIHAMDVAESLGLDLLLGSETQASASPLRAAWTRDRAQRRETQHRDGQHRNEISREVQTKINRQDSRCSLELLIQFAQTRAAGRHVYGRFGHAQKHLLILR